jgi:beta-galactosidase
VPHIWRCGNQGNVASVLIEKPARGDFLPLVDGGFSLQYSPLLEYHEGQGLVMFCQLDVTGRTETDPAARILVQNILGHAASWKPMPSRTIVYAGDPAGLRHLESSGFQVTSFQGKDLSPAQVLVAGPGAGKELAGSARAIAQWLEAGGHVLAIGLDERDANAFLPFHASTAYSEHISAHFDPFDRGSPFAGVSPADVHNRDPRTIPLVKTGAISIGDGVLARSERGNIVFCQLVPWQFQDTGNMNIKRTFRRASFLLSRLLGNMGIESTTPILERVHSPVAATSEKRWLAGFYLEQPEEMDDPYRFFRW